MATAKQLSRENQDGCSGFPRARKLSPALPPPQPEELHSSEIGGLREALLNFLGFPLLNSNKGIIINFL